MERGQPIVSYIIVIAFLFLSIVAYTVLGGADFGIGIIELLNPREKRQWLRKVGAKAIAPVWEANHIWMIIALVILFVGFPKMHYTLVTALHIPMVLMLVGITLRGTAFVFRSYSIEGKSNATTTLWTILFRTGSVIVPMTFGVVTAALPRGKIPAHPSDFFASYIQPWIGWFPFLTGIFVTCLCAWLACVFLSGELTGPERQQMIRQSRIWTVLFVIAGGCVSLAAYQDGVSWLLASGSWGLRMTMVVLGTISIVAVSWLQTTQRVWMTRIVSGITIFAIIGGYWLPVYPDGIMLDNGDSLTWIETAAPTATLNTLAATLIIGSFFILPGLAWLYRIFKLPPMP